MARSAGVRRSPRSLGQGLVEFALILPVLLLILMLALDFGRVFFGWVALNNTARIAANYAATNPKAWSSANAAQLSQYRKLITDDFTALNCTQPTPLPTPTFPLGTALGATAEVRLSCDFDLITPVISDVFGGGLSVGASAVFPIRAGVVAGIPGGGATPIASFTVAPGTSGVAPFTVTLTDTSSPTPISWEWDFGDGTPSFTGPNPPPHTYTAGATYTVTLTVSDGLSATTAAKTITVEAAGGPVAAFTYSLEPPSARVPVVVTLTDASTGDPVSWAWDFGNGGSADVQNPDPQQYNTPGTYTITLAITDADGLSDTASQSIIIKPPTCIVPDFKNVITSDAVQATWLGAGFEQQVVFNPARPPEFKITKQDPAAGSSQLCAETVITVFDKPDKP